MKNFEKSKLLRKTNKELEVYINQPEKFGSEAVDCAISVLRERGVEVIAPIQIRARKEGTTKNIFSSIKPYQLLSANIFCIHSYVGIQVFMNCN
jgi:hypothetical protein